MDTWMWALKKQMLAQQRPIEDNRGLVALNQVNIYRVVFHDLCVFRRQRSRWYTISGHGRRSIAFVYGLESPV